MPKKKKLSVREKNVRKLAKLLNTPQRVIREKIKGKQDFSKINVTQNLGHFWKNKNGQGVSFFGASFGLSEKQYKVKKVKSGRITLSGQSLPTEVSKDVRQKIRMGATKEQTLDFVKTEDINLLIFSKNIPRFLEQVDRMGFEIVYNDLSGLSDVTDQLEDETEEMENEKMYQIFVVFSFEEKQLKIIGWQ